MFFKVARRVSRFYLSYTGRDAQKFFPNFGMYMLVDAFGTTIGTVCTINFSGAGTGTAKDKKAACGELKGKWEEDECRFIKSNMAG